MTLDFRQLARWFTLTLSTLCPKKIKLIWLAITSMILINCRLDQVR